jgi:hypothetical protein
MKKSQALKALIVPALFLSSCNISLINPTPAPELSAPPVEGETSAPPLETSAEEIIMENFTPTGVCVMYKDKEVLDCFDVDGKLIFTLQVPGIGSLDSQGLHIAGPLEPGMIPPPVVYHSWEPEQALLQSENGNTTSLRKTNSFLAISGAAGEPVLAFSDVTFENKIPHSYIYSGTLPTLGSANAFFDMKDAATGMALMPVAVEAAGKQARKVWYTHTAWEITGADRVYPINSGLYVYDLETGQNTQVLGAERNFQGLSPDKTQVGSISFNIKDDHSMRVTNLLTGHMVNFPLNPASDRGAGYAVFSIDGKYAAWLEASGSMIAEPPDFQSRIKIGDIESGAVVNEMDSSTISQILGWDRISFMRPIGWLNAQILVLEVHGIDRNIAAVIKYDISTGNQQQICECSFAGFSYP